MLATYRQAEAVAKGRTARNKEESGVYMFDLGGFGVAGTEPGTLTDLLASGYSLIAVVNPRAGVSHCFITLS